MKRKCKNVDITDINFIENCVRDSLKNKKKNRKDIQRVFEEYGILKHSNSKMFCNKYGVYQKLKKAKGVISHADSLRFKNATS